LRLAKYKKRISSPFENRFSGATEVEFKAKVRLEALKGIEPVHVIAQRDEVHPVQVQSLEERGGGEIAGGLR
jgi:hypothetical protein